MDSLEILGLLVNVIVIYVLVLVAYFAFNSTIFGRISSRSDNQKFMQKRLVAGYSVEDEFRFFNWIIPGLFILISIAVFSGFLLSTDILASFPLSFPFLFLIPLGIILGMIAPLDGIAVVLPDVLYPGNLIMPGSTYGRPRAMAAGFGFASMSLFWNEKGGLSGMFGTWMRRAYTILLIPLQLRSVFRLASARTIEDADEYPELKF